MLLPIAIVLGVAAAAAGGAKKDKNAPDKGKTKPDVKPGDPELQQLGLHEALVGRVDGDQYRAGAGAEILPTVVLLHGEGDDPSLARQVLPKSRPLRVIVPLGRIADLGPRRRYVDPMLAGVAYRQALVKEADDLVAVVVAATQRFNVSGRLVMIGLGTAGAIAVLNAMRGGAFVRAGLGAGGTLTADWVPPKAPPDPARLYKLSWGDAVGFDTLAMQAAAERGWPARLDVGDLDVIGSTPDPMTSRAWLEQYWAELDLA